MQLQTDGCVAVLLMCLAGVIGCGDQSGKETTSSGTQPKSSQTSISQSSESSENPPRVISTSPANGETDVDPGLEAITVTFDRAMKSDSFAWSYEKKEDFPDVQGTPSYDSEQTTNTLPVKLAPGRQYAIWLNTAEMKGFVTVDGEPSPPYKLVFTTRGTEDNEHPATPTPTSDKPGANAAKPDQSEAADKTEPDAPQS